MEKKIEEVDAVLFVIGLFVSLSVGYIYIMNDKELIGILVAFFGILTTFFFSILIFELSRIISFQSNRD